MGVFVDDIIINIPAGLLFLQKSGLVRVSSLFLVLSDVNFTRDPIKILVEYLLWRPHYKSPPIPP